MLGQEMAIFNFDTYGICLIENIGIFLKEELQFYKNDNYNLI